MAYRAVSRLDDPVGVQDLPSGTRMSGIARANERNQCAARATYHGAGDVVLTEVEGRVRRLEESRDVFPRNAIRRQLRQLGVQIADAGVDNLRKALH